MKTFCLIFISLLLAAPALAGPWLTRNPVELSPSDTSVTIEVGEKLGKIDNLRFQIEGATVHLDGLTLIPAQGQPIALKIPGLLKSGESSGLINIPGMALAIEKLRLEYRISDGKTAFVTFKIKQD